MNPEQNIKYICEKYFIREAYIFGSEISGFKHPGSDLDIGIIFKNGLPETGKIMIIYGEIFSDLSKFNNYIKIFLKKYNDEFSTK